MNKISLIPSKYNDSTLLSNIFIDEYMPLANGSYVKVYLYLVRLIQGLQPNITISAIADKLDNTENDILRALSYWEKVGLLVLEKNASNEIQSLMLTDLSNTQSEPQYPTNEVAASFSQVAEYTPTASSNMNAQISDSVQVSEKHHFSESEISKITSDEDVKWMLNIIEVYLEHPLRPVDTQLIMYLYEKLNFSRELIMYLYEYCISKGKKNCSYIEAVALSWANDGIDTVEKAEANATLYNTNYNAVSKAFGLNRAPGTAEQQYINKWTTKYKFSIEIIIEACNRTLLKTAKPDFKYADKILENWSCKGVQTQKDIARLDEEHKKSSIEKNSTTNYSKQTTTNNRFNAFPQREYSKEDYSNLEQKLMNLDYFSNND